MYRTFFVKTYKMYIKTKLSLLSKLTRSWLSDFNRHFSGQNADGEKKDERRRVVVTDRQKDGRTDERTKNKRVWSSDQIILA